MNENKVQAEITRIIENYRKDNGKFARKQYPASKKNLARAEELGILHLIPNAPYSASIGNTEIQLIIREAENNGSAVFNQYGEGVEISASALYLALNEVEETEAEINGGGETTISVNPNGDEFEIEVGNITISGRTQLDQATYGNVSISVWVWNSTWCEENNFEDEFGYCEVELKNGGREFSAEEETAWNNGELDEIQLTFSHKDLLDAAQLFVDIYEEHLTN